MDLSYDSNPLPPPSTKNLNTSIATRFKTRHYTYRVQHDSTIDAQLAKIQKLRNAQKRIHITNFFSKFRTTLTPTAQRGLRSITDNMNNSFTLSKNYDAMNKLWCHDVIYLITQQSPPRMKIDAVQQYCEDLTRNKCTSKQVGLLYTLLESVGQNQESVTNDEPIFSVNESSNEEDEVLLSEDEEIEVEF